MAFKKILLSLLAMAGTAQAVSLRTNDSEQFVSASAPRNYALNSGAERPATGTPSGVTSSIVTRVTSGALLGDGSFQVLPTAAAQTASWTTKAFQNVGPQCEADFIYSGAGGSNLTARVFNGATPLSNLQSLSAVTVGTLVSLAFPCPAVGVQPVLTLTSIASGTAVLVDDVYIGRALWFGSVNLGVPQTPYTATFAGVGITSQAMYYSCAQGRVTVQGDFVVSSTSATTFSMSTPLPIDTTKYTTSAGVMVGFQARGAGTANKYAAIIVQAGVSNGLVYVGGFNGDTQNPLTAQIGTNNFGIENQSFNFQYWTPACPGDPSAIIRANQPTLPTITKLTSGSGTYTPPVGAIYLKVRMVGGGGGGGGGGSTGNTGGTTGGATTLGSSFLTANGGQGGGQGSGAGSPGGSASIASPAYGTFFQGGNGGTFGGNSTGAALGGGNGGVSPFGGAASGGSNTTTGNPPVANTGSGGGGGGCGTSTSCGHGGGAGGYIDVVIPNPSAVTYSVGVGGNAGNAGTNGSAGTAGAAGYIEITEYYTTSAPFLANTVVSSYTGVSKVNAGRITATGSVGACSLTSANGDWVTSASSPSSQRCNINFKTGYFTSTPWCVLTSEIDLVAPVGSISVVSTNSFQIRTATDGAYSFVCYGNN